MRALRVVASVAWAGCLVLAHAADAQGQDDSCPAVISYPDQLIDSAIARAQCLRGLQRFPEAASVLQHALGMAQPGDPRVPDLQRMLLSMASPQDVCTAVAPCRNADRTVREAVDAARRIVTDLRDLDEVPNVSIDARAQARALSFIGTGSTLVPTDYYNAQHALAYKVQPIVLAGVHADIRLGSPLISDVSEFVKRHPEFLNLRFGYETDRVYQSGGSITPTGPLAQELGIRGEAADVLNGAITLLGVGVEGEYATFTNGRVQEQNLAAGTVVSDAPLQFTRKRVELTFDTSQYWELPGASWHRTNQYERFHDGSSAWVLRAVYYDLTLPRIAYLVQSDAQGNAIVAAESAPQTIDVSLAAGGLSYRWAMLTGKYGFLQSEYTLLFGGGSVNFTMPASTSMPQGPGNQVALSEATVAVVSRVGVRGEVRLALDQEFQSNLYFGASLGAEQYYANAQVPGSLSGVVGFSDAFWSAMGYASFRFDYRRDPAVTSEQ